MERPYKPRARNLLEHHPYEKKREGYAPKQETRDINQKVPIKNDRIQELLDKLAQRKATSLVGVREERS